MYLKLATYPNGHEVAKIFVRDGDVCIDSLNEQFGYEDCGELWHFLTESPLTVRTKSGIKNFIPTDKYFLQAVVLFLSQNPNLGLLARMYVDGDSIQDLRDVLFTLSQRDQLEIIFRMYKLVFELYGLTKNPDIRRIIKAIENRLPIEPKWFVHLFLMYDEEFISALAEREETSDEVGNPIATIHVCGLFHLVTGHPDFAFDCIWQSALMPENTEEFTQLFKTEIQNRLELQINL